MKFNEESILVTGGGGFLGRAITKRLLELKCRDIRIFCRSPQPDFQAQGIETINGDIRDVDAVLRACENRSLVFHTAAKTGIFGKKNDYFEVNFTGTGNILKSCVVNNVKSLVYTSSPSVVLPSDCDIENCDETLPYPEKYLAHYPKSKAFAEQMVIAADSAGLATVSLRPHLIWGPGDPYLLPRIIQKAREGRLKIVGDGKNLVDITYIDNAVDAHIKAAEKLRTSQSCRGKAYFISDGEPVVMWDWLNNILKALGIPPVTKKLSYRTAYRVGAFMETVFSIFPFLGEPPMTRFVAGQLAYSHYFDISAAKKDFDYSPNISKEKAFEKTISWLKKTSVLNRK